MHELILDNQPVAVRAANLEEVLALRHAELRPGLPVEAARFDADADPAARHFGAFDAGANIACASFLPSEWEGEPACQLRGMATRADYTRRGVGSALLRFAERSLTQEAGVTCLWCNARLPAVPFYQKHGWTLASEPFDIPTVGPHHRMKKVSAGRAGHRPASSPSSSKEAAGRAGHRPASPPSSSKAGRAGHRPVSSPSSPKEAGP